MCFILICLKNSFYFKDTSSERGNHRANTYFTRLVEAWVPPSGSFPLKGRCVGSVSIFYFPLSLKHVIKTVFLQKKLNIKKKNVDVILSLRSINEM